MGYFQYDFIVKNNKYEHNPVVLADDELDSWWYLQKTGSGNLDGSMSLSSSTVKSGNESLLLSIVSGSYDGIHLCKDFSTAQDWSSYDFYCYWLKGAGTGKIIDTRIWTPNTNNEAHYSIEDDTENWKWVVIPLRVYSTIEGTFDLSNVQALRISIWQAQAWSPTKTLFFDRFLLDVGRWVDLELYVPDNLASYPNSYMELWSWSGSEWVKFCEWHGDGVYLCNDIYTTDGWSLKSVFDFLPVEVYPQDEYGETVEGIRGLRSITYSQKYGTRYRVGFSLYMPPRKSIKLRLRCNFQVTEVASLNV